MTQISDMIFKATDRNLISTIMAVDQTATFDCINHEVLENKMRLYNFDTSTRRWFMNYLKFRTQYVVIGSKKSIMKPITMGVPQGSVLGPMLFTLYVNEMSLLTSEIDCDNKTHENCENLFPENCLNCGSITSYANDSNFLISNKSRDVIQRKLEKMLQSS